MTNSSAPLWLRFIAPSVLLLALCVTALPVLEVGLEGKPQDFDSWNKTRESAGKPRGAADGKLVILTQAGFQSIWAGYSWGPDLAEEKAQQAKVDPEVRRKFREQIKKREKEFEDMARAKGAVVTKTRTPTPGPAVLMIFYVLLLLGAAVVGCALPSGLLRVGLFCGTVVAAALCLGLQMLIGFPFANVTHREVTSMKHQFDGVPRFDMKTGKWEESGKVQVFTHRPPWDHMAWPVLLAAMTLACLDFVIGSARPKKRNTEERDERPGRRRARRDEYEEEDERERMRSRRRRG